MPVAIERDALYRAIDRLPENTLIELARFIEFLQFKSQHDAQVNEDTTTKEKPPFNPVYFPGGILQGYEFSPEFIADARKELWTGLQSVPAALSGRCPQFGSAKGLIVMTEDFDAPLEDFEEYMP
jgi:hypothetical protein